MVKVSIVDVQITFSPRGKKSSPRNQSVFLNSYGVLLQTVVKKWGVNIDAKTMKARLRRQSPILENWSVGWMSCWVDVLYQGIILNVLENGFLVKPVRLCK